MNIYLAGGVSGNINKLWRDYVKIYLAGTGSKPFLYDNLLGGRKRQSPNIKTINDKKKANMDVMIAGNHPVKHGKYRVDNGGWTGLYILESYIYAKNNKCIKDLLESKQMKFILDSGAFTFMNKEKDKTNFENYVYGYAEFINKYNIDLFFELDIDIIVGLKEVERLRILLEKLTNKKCIPVWHKSRGIDYWKKMCQDYSYVAIGGIVTKEIKATNYALFNSLIAIANKTNTKVHGLGFTNTIGLQRCKFYSVDSTAWLYGNRGGFLYKFNGKTIEKINKPEGTRIKGMQVAIHNFNEWVKFQEYAKNHL